MPSSFFSKKWLSQKKYNKVFSKSITKINNPWYRSSLVEQKTKLAPKIVPQKKKKDSQFFMIWFWVLAIIISVGPFTLYQFFSPSPNSVIILNNPMDEYSLVDIKMDTVQVTIRDGEVLANAILRYLPEIQGVYQAVNTLDKNYDLRRVPSGQIFFVTYTKDNNKTILESLTFVTPRDHQTVQIFRDKNNQFKIKNFNEYISVEKRSVKGTVHSNLYLAGLDANVPPNVLMNMFDLFSFNVDFQRDIRVNDQFELVYEQYLDSNGNPTRSGNILAAKLKVHSGTVESFRFEYEPNFFDYFDRNGKSLKKALLLMPVQGGRLTSGYKNRINPVHGYSEFHPALDFAAPKGTPIMSAGNGTVIHRGWDPKGYGNYVKVQHPNNMVTLYAHMSAFSASAPVGSRVQQGEIIGYVGSTGMSTGPHVHYEVWVNGRRQNPATVVRNMSSGISLSSKQLDSFKEYIIDLEQYFS